LISVVVVVVLVVVVAVIVVVVEVVIIIIIANYLTVPIVISKSVSYLRRICHAAVLIFVITYLCCCHFRY
jgi:hypothetical protein